MSVGVSLEGRSRGPGLRLPPSVCPLVGLSLRTHPSAHGLVNESGYPCLVDRSQLYDRERIPPHIAVIVDALSLKPSVEYLVLNFCEGWKKQVTLPSLA